MPDAGGTPPILVVDDNAVNRRVAALFVQRHGRDVDVAASGAEALALLATGSYSLVLMDCQMPEMDGYATAAAIRERYPAPRLPIVAVSADSSADVRARDVQGVMDDVIEKPINLEQLGDVIRRWAS
jgi:CheY-like chemotaxis protein